MSVAIGIDLGTTNTVVGVVRDGLAQTIETAEGGRLIPSVVSFHPSGSVLVGQPARERRLIDPENTIYSVKRLIGRPWNSEEVQQARGRFAFKLVEGPKNTTMVVARDVAYALPEMSAFVLRRAKAVAEAALGEEVDRAVITVPANFNDLQRASTKIAGKLAGLEVLRILNEPTAAALAYGQSIAQAEKIAIYDLGGGTFDITLLDLSGSVFEVLSTAGDTSLGGDDMDLLVADKMSEHIMRTHRFDPRTNPVAFGRLRLLGEMIKMQLSVQPEASVEISDIGYGEGGQPLTATFRMTRDELEKTVAELVDRTVEVSRFSIETIGMKVEQFDRVILVGGATRMPMVQRAVQTFFKKPPHLRINPDEVVALGAAIQAYSLNRAKAKRPRKSGPPVATNLAEASAATGAPPARISAPPSVPDLPLVNPSNRPPPQQPAAQPIAAQRPPTPAAAVPPQQILEISRTAPTLTFSPPPPPAGQRVSEPKVTVAAKPPQGITHGLIEELDVEPDPSSAQNPAPRHPEPEIELGALPSNRRAPSNAPAGPARAIRTREDAPLLIDVTPLSLRVETVAGYSDALITANTPVPCDRTKVFLTASDNQTQVFVRVAQGESNKFEENAYLGEVELTGLPAGPRGEVRIAVTFELDADGILNVRAKDEKSGRAAAATLKLLGANTDASDVAMMMARQQRHAVH